MHLCLAGNKVWRKYWSAVFSQTVPARLRGEGITRPTRIERAGWWAVPFPTASLKELSKKECSTPIWFLLACYVISHVTARPVTYWVLLWLWGILTSHLRHYECFEKCSTPPIIFEKIELHFPLYIIINLAASVESELCRITLDYFSCLLQENSKNPRHNKWISDLDKV